MRVEQRKKKKKEKKRWWMEQKKRGKKAKQGGRGIWDVRSFVNRIYSIRFNDRFNVVPLIDDP